MNVWLVILLVGAFTFLERSSFILLFSRWEMPNWLRGALRFVPAAVFSALIAPTILRTEGSLDISLLNPKLLAALVAIVVASRGGSILLTIIAGMLALWAVTWAI